jgi:hypothetical protein
MHTANLDSEFKAILASVVGGGIGAAVSVMTRTTSGKLLLDYRAPRWLLVALGAFRVVIGSTFGIALLLLLEGNILSLEGPNWDHVSEWLFFYAGLAFIAGFSERFAQDMLAMSEKSFTPSVGERKPPPAASGTSTN